MLDAAPPTLLWECEDFRVFLRDTGSDLLVVSFSPMDWPERNQVGRHWGDAVARKLPMSWLAIDARHPHWFPPEKWRRIEDLVRATAGRFAVRVGLGHSMGAYAALRHSRDYGATCILAFAPQCSIDPAEVASFDTRYASHFDSRLHRGMGLQPQHVAGQAYVFYDAMFDRDRGHVHRIAGERVCKVSVPHTRHDVIHAAKGSMSLAYLIMRAVAEPSSAGPELHRYLRRQKKEQPAYLLNLASKALSARHARWAMTAAARARRSTVDRPGATLLYAQACLRLGQPEAARVAVQEVDRTAWSDKQIVMLARVLGELGDEAQALAMMDRPAVSEGHDVASLRTLADLLLKAGQTGRAVKLLTRATELKPDDAHAMAQLGRALLRDRTEASYDPHLAAVLLGRAVALAPSVLPFWKGLGFALEACGDPAGAWRAWQQAERAGPLSPADHKRIEVLSAKVAAVPNPVVDAMVV